MEEALVKAVPTDLGLISTYVIFAKLLTSKATRLDTEQRKQNNSNTFTL